jgi:hypothetical protein
MPAASIQARPAAESCQMEMLHAHRNVDVQGARGHIQGAARRNDQCNGAHLRRHPRADPEILRDRARGRSLVGIYLWANKAAADAFYTAEWLAMVAKRWGAPPQRQEWETPMVVESAKRRLIAAE